METIVSIRPFLAVLVSILAVPLIVSTRRTNFREGWTFFAAFAKFSIIASMTPVILDGVEIEYTIAQVLPSVAIKLKVDAFGMLFALVSSFLWIVTSAYSIGYMRLSLIHI